MSLKETLILQLSQRANALSETRLAELNEFAEFLSFKEANLTTDSIMKLMDKSGAFNFVNEDPSVYTIDDCKEKYKP
ncbi:MAG: hypothetical protein ACKVOR_03925 [Flavobacteriales bacterium]